MNDLVRNILFFVALMIAVLVVKWIAGFEIAVLFAIVEVAVTIYGKSDK
ncbi:hypothetical protein [Lactococcus lactis]|nr:hypothetical protein [Lactococcus lactis]WDA67503.1 hypothetical protein IL310_01100 [Lactococcus lactis]WDA67538.1 hypothetical protein IL310_01275 [Lactococcus lactis]